MLSAGPTPRVGLGSWEFRVTTETGLHVAYVYTRSTPAGWPVRAGRIGAWLDLRGITCLQLTLPAAP